MEVKDICKIFLSSTKISIENFNDVLYSGELYKANKWKESNLEVVECEIRNDVLHVQVSL